jgi:hypothetical protein
LGESFTGLAVLVDELHGVPFSQQPLPKLADQWELSFPVYRAHPPAIACPSADRQATSET